MSYRIGCHVPSQRAQKVTDEIGADVIQIHVGSPRQWKISEFHKEIILSPDTPTYIHAPYVINLASVDDNKLRSSLWSLFNQLWEADKLSALGLVIHGGNHKLHDIRDAFKQYRDILGLAGEAFKIPVLIENSTSGKFSPVRTIEHFKLLYEYVGDLPNVGFCLDTCHAWASGEDPGTFAMQLREVVENKIKLVHANGCLAGQGDKQDRHSPFHSSVLPYESILDAIRTSGTEDVVVESSDPISDMYVLKEDLYE